MARRPRFSGSIYQRGPVWQLQYVVDGQRFRESAKTASKDDAAKLLKKRLREVQEGAKPAKAASMKLLAELLFTAKEARLKPSTMAWMRRLWKHHIQPTFGHRAPGTITAIELDRFVSKRKADGASDCYVNRALVVLKAVMHYAIRNRAMRAEDMPEFPEKFDEKPFVRRGHVDSWDFIRLVEAIEEPWLEALVTAAFTFGFRKSELLYMRCNQIDLERGTIILPAGSTKNRLPRRVVLNTSGKLAKLLRAATDGKRAEAYVFSRDPKGSYPVRDFRGAFDKAATAAKIKSGSGPNGKLYFHDLRRSSITRMAGAGLNEAESMAVAGHLSVDVHRRYRILSDGAARAIAQRIDQ
jgi:integrase